MSFEVLEHEPDLLVLADRVHTPAVVPGVGALLIRGGRILATGSYDALRGLAPHPRVRDLRGTTITPGLTDAHAHLVEWACARRDADLTHAASPAAAAHELARHLAAARTRSAHDWVRGRGWNPHLWGAAAPHRSVLDEVIADRPVVLQSHDMHALWVNSAALHAAGITAATPDPEGGHIVRDEKGEPTGVLLEWAGQLVTQRIPAPSVQDAAAAVVEAQAELHSLGITGVHSFPHVHLRAPQPLAVAQQLKERGELHLRVLQHISLDQLALAVELGVRSGMGDEWLRIGAVKMFLDGALGSLTAWMREPYSGHDGCGMRTLEPDAFRAAVRTAADAGIASAVHAIGDAAVCLALDVLGDPATRVAALPHRIEHLQCCPLERVGDAALHGITASMQPAHLITDWRVADRHWGAERGRGTYALASLLQAGTILAFGSDVPVEPVDPRRGLHAAVLRQDLGGEPHAGWFPHERITAEDALRGYTIGPARAAGLPAPAGTLAPGAPADLCAWDIDPYAEPHHLLAMRCVATMVGGRTVHES